MKKKPLVINYAGQRIMLNTIATYFPYSKTERHSTTKFGISYTLRSGGTLMAYGDDPILRDEALAFLDEAFGPTQFMSNKCHVCVNRYTTLKTNDCGTKYDCYGHRGYHGFVREK